MVPFDSGIHPDTGKSHGRRCVGSHRHEGGGENLSYSVDKRVDRADNNNKILSQYQNKNTSCCGRRTTKNTSCCTELRKAQYATYSGKEALEKLEQKLDQRLRVAVTHFSNNAAQGFVQQSLPQMLLGGHWLTEKFQFLSTLAWQSGDDKGGILGELDIVVPLYGTRNAAEIDQTGWFLQPGLVSWEADNGDRRLDVNIGLTHRRLLRERIAIGAAVFYDHNIDSDLKRIGAGADIISPYTYLAVNYYEPLDGWRTGERLGYEERALRGVDVNIEQALWDSHWVLEASGGYWKGYDSDKRRGEWQPAGSVGIRYYPLDYLSVYADYAYHHDNVDTDRFAAGVEFSYPGKQRDISENVVDVWHPATREKRILYAERKKMEMVTPTLTLTTNPANVTAGSAISLSVTSDVAVAGTLTLSLVISGQVVAADFTGGLTQSVNANFNGGTTAMVTIATEKFGITAKTYMITLSSGTGYMVGSDSTAAGTINEAMPTLTLASDPTDTAGGGAISLLITSDIAIVGTLTLPLTISGQVAAADFTNGLTQSVSANFNGSTTAMVMIATVKDTDAVESYTIMLGSGTGYTVGSDSTATGRITVALPFLTLVTDPSAVNAGNSISLVITSDETIASTLTVALTISDRGSSGIVAGDFTGGLTQSVSANFGGATTATVMIATERFGGSAKSYTITLGSGTGYTAGSDNTAAGTINAVTPTLSLLANPAAVTAGEDISLVITSDIPVVGSLTVDISFPLTTTTIAVLGRVVDVMITASDIDGNLGQRSVSVNFNGSTTATVTIGTVRDGDMAAEDYIIILLSRAGYNGGSLAVNSAVGGTINPM